MKKGNNKMVKSGNKAVLQKFFFPEHKMTIEAKDSQEAEMKLEKILIKKK